MDYPTEQDEIRREWEKVKSLPINERIAPGKIRKSNEGRKKIKEASQVLETIVREHTEQIYLTDLNALLYAAATVFTGGPNKKKNNKQRTDKSRWQTNIEQSIAAIRKDL